MATRKTTPRPPPGPPAPEPPPPGIERKTLPIRALSRATYNPRRISDRAKAALRVSLKEFGLVQEIVVNVRKDGELRVVGGHQRLDILQEDHGLDYQVPVVLVRLSDAREKALNLTLNNAAMAGEYTRDVDRLIADLEASDDVDEAMRDSLLLGDVLELVARDDAAATMRSLSRGPGDTDEDDDGDEDDRPAGQGNGARPGPPAGAPPKDDKPAEGKGAGETRGLGKPVVSYQIVFDDEAQQERFYVMLRNLRERYGDSALTIAARLDRFVTESEDIWKGF